MKFSKTLIAAGLAAACLSVSAQSTTGNINVNANVVAACNITTNPLAFGSYSSLSATALDVSASLGVTCSQGSVATVSLAGGNNELAGQRRMTDGTAFLNYSIFKPATSAAGAACAYTDAWGPGGGGTTFATTAAPDLNTRNYNVCGRIPAGQSVPVGSYTDVVVATVSF